ncbi:MAG: FHA domain-containing protein [Cyanobacteria bacterium SIG26]|nr:FHA domain-containing protein [Cyanobacteria bacterium SIG26]
MAEFNEIKFKGQISNYTTLKAGLKRSDLSGDAKLQSIFDAIDSADTNGVKDGILNQNEINTFMQKVVEFAKGGRDKDLSTKDTNKLLQSLGLTNVDETNLFSLLNAFSTQSKDIVRTTVNPEYNSQIIEYVDGHTEEIYTDGSKTITTKHDNTTTITNQDANGNSTSRTEITTRNGIETVIRYEGERPVSKIVTDTRNNTISTYVYDDNNTEILTKEENANTGDVTTYENGQKTITKEDGTIITEKDGIITTTTPDGNQTIQDTNTGSNTTIVTNSENNTTTQTTIDAQGRQTVLTSIDGKNQSQTVTVDGTTYTVEYDGNGNTKGVTVQNGESPALVAKRFGCSLEDLIAANPEAIKGKAPNQYFLVGSDIVIPGEIDADKFAQLTAGRQTKEQAISGYENYMAQVERENQEVENRKQYRRTFTEQKCNTFEECAREYFRIEGVTNPTRRQVQLRIEELEYLNPNLKDGEIKGQKIIVTFNAQTDAAIGSRQQAREEARIQASRQAEVRTGSSMAKTMHSAVDDHIGGVTESDFKNTLNKVSADNVVGLIEQYNEISPDETLIEAIMDETWNTLEERKNAINKIVNALIERANNLDISDERQRQAINAIKQELNSYWSMGIGYCQTSKLDGLVNNLIGQIKAAEAVTNEERTRGLDNGINDALALMGSQYTENNEAFNAQLAEDGWCADLYEGWKWTFGSDNLDENVRADLETYKGYMAQLEEAGKTGGEEGFKAKFKEIFGVDYNPVLIKGYNKLQTNFAMAQGLTMQKDEFARQFGTCIAGTESYNSMRSKYGDYLVSLAQAESQTINADQAVDEAIKIQLSKEGIDFSNATDDQKQKALKTVITNTYKAIESELNKYTNGQSLTAMQKDLKAAGSGVFGNKNDIAFRVNDYIASQQQGGAAVNMAVKTIGALAIGVATGGYGLVAITTAAVATTGLNAAIDLSDRASSDVGLKDGEITEILKNATIDGATVFAGAKLGKYAMMFKHASTFIQAGGRFAIMVAGDIATGTATEYLRTGTITLEGVAFQAVFSASGNLVGLKALGKADIPPTATTGNPQPSRVSRGVSGDVNNHRDIVTDGQVARGADQSHLSSSERAIVEEGLEDVPTSAELSQYQIENGYQPVPEADQAVYASHQNQVATDYSNAHTLENNAVISEARTPVTAQPDAVAQLNNQINAVDGQIAQIERQIAGAKRMGKNTDRLEAQLANLQSKKTQLTSELEQIQNPVVNTPETPVVDDVNARPVDETPATPVVEDVKPEITPDDLNKAVNSIPDAEIPVANKSLWESCKNRLSEITAELKDFKGDIDAMLAKCENLIRDLKTIANNASAAVKNKINQLIEDLRSMLSSKRSVRENFTPTPEQRMAMNDISTGINRAKTIDDIAALQAQLDDMPNCPQKQRLQDQLNSKMCKLTNTNNTIQTGQDIRLKDGIKQQVSPDQTIRLGDAVDINLADLQNRFNAMSDGDSFIIGREATGINDIKINSGYISAQHLKVEKINGKIYITDLSSTHGTILNCSKPNYAARWTPELKDKFTNADGSDFATMIENNYDELRGANYSIEESVRGNITDADLINHRNNKDMGLYGSNGWYFRSPRNRTPVDVSNCVDRISLNVVADKRLLSELDRLCTTGVYVNAQGQTVKINMPDCTYKTPATIESFTTRHDPITMYFSENISSEVETAIAEIASKYARRSSNGKALMNALDGKPYIAHEAYVSVGEAQSLYNEALQLNPELADAVKYKLGGYKDWNTSTGMYAACKRLVKEYRMAQG